VHLPKGKTNNQRNLARAPTKSKSKMQQALMDLLVEQAMNQVVEEHPNIGDLVK